MNIPRFPLTVSRMALLCSIYIVLVNNDLFWASLFKVVDVSVPHYLGFAAAFFVFIAGVLSLLFILLSQRLLFKPVLVIAVLASAMVSYFQNEYGVIIDKSMIQNIVETDYREASELLTFALFLHTALYGLLPAALIVMLPIRYNSISRELFSRGVFVGLVLATTSLSVFAYYKDFSLINREHKELRLYINPTYPIFATYSYVAEKTKAADKPVQAIATDARRQQVSPRRTVAVLVVGETARAANFSLNGYARQTNPKLATDNVINFNNARSCGTSTAESLPCMFSHLGRSDYSVEQAAQYTNVLDILQATGVNVVWRDNNSGCKGVCNRVKVVDYSGRRDPVLCPVDECFDEIMLDDLQKYLATQSGDTLIVLHQKGSHGPAYYKRHPESFTKFKPECTKSAAQDCSREELANAYDNTILYTDHFLHRVVELLGNNGDSYDAVMLYMSDHGELLGENGLYLHGLPYILAPDELTHVPFIAWLSGQYASNHALNEQCLREAAGKRYSHDNIFHSLLGMFDVETGVYQSELDIFSSCRKS